MYAGINQRWLIFYSPEAYQRVLITSKQTLKQSTTECKKCFILATNQLDCKELPDSDIVVVYYKDQQKVEGVFCFLKDPLIMAPTIFLKSHKRVMALMMVMTICLMVYAALEYRICETLKKQAVTFPDQHRHHVNLLKLLGVEYEKSYAGSG